MLGSLAARRAPFLVVVSAVFGLLIPVRPARADHHSGPAPAPGAIEVPAEGISLPMEDFGGRPVVSVEIGGQGPFRFVVDTGASVSVISPRLQERLSLSAARGVQAMTPGGGPAPVILSIPVFRLGPVVIRDLMAAVLPGNPFAGEDAPLGILSGSSFPGYLLTFDYPRKQISIRKGELASSESGSLFDYSAEDPLPTVPIRVAGRPLRAHLDTGSGHGLTLPAKLLKELPLDSEPAAAGMAKTHGGESPMVRAKVRGPIELGALKLEIPEVVFSDVPSGADPTIGNLGSQVLREFVVTLDVRNRRIRVERP